MTWTERAVAAYYRETAGQPFTLRRHNVAHWLTRRTLSLRIRAARSAALAAQYGAPLAVA